MMHTGPGRPAQAIDLSLNRITELLQRLGSPQSRFPIIHVAGTNSKGSTIAYLNNILTHSIGISTGSFTSPHLIIERDCCKLDDRAIDEVIWDEAARRVTEADASPSSSSSSLPLNSSPFELLTARCFVAFDILPPSQRPELLLVEVGMGGALDATNVFSPRQVMASVITPIDYDHQSFLGNTLSEIAGQKAGIVKEGGLCILADQRKQQASGGEGEGEQVDCTTLKVSNDEAQGEGKEAAEIQEAVRRTCAERQARLVKAFVPWQALTSSDAGMQAGSQPPSPSSPWSALAKTSVRFTPVLMPSKLRAGNYVSSAGDPVVPGPAIVLPRTRAALTGCHLALQTLWSIARDETPCALGQSGSDSNEELRLRIAYGLQDERRARVSLESSITQTRIHGRAEWIDVELDAGDQTSAEQMDVDGSEDGQPTTAAPVRLHALVDGAHNPSAAIALHEYVRQCIQHRLQSSDKISKVTVTWLVAFSQGKDLSSIISGLLGEADTGVDGLTSGMASTLLDTHIEHRIGCLPFTTPVEGMPWVASVPADEVASAFTTHAKASTMVSSVQTFAQLDKALLWAAEEGDGRALKADGSVNVVVIAGSLYLVSDVHRLVSRHNLPNSAHAGLPQPLYSSTSTQLR